MRDVFLFKEIWAFKKCDSVNWQNNILWKKIYLKSQSQEFLKSVSKAGQITKD